MFMKHRPKELDRLKPECMTVIKYNTTQTTESQILDKSQSPHSLLSLPSGTPELDVINVLG